MHHARALEELQQIAMFVDELPVAIWVGSVPSGEAVYVNKAFREVLGIEPPEQATRGNYVGPYSVHTPEGDPYPEHEMPYERALAARAAIEVDNMVIHRHDGGRTYLRVYARPLFDAAGVITHVLEGFTDITREMLSKQDQRERETQLRQAQRMESLGSLAGGIAHDFNNLLAVIRIIASHLASKEPRPELREGLEQIDEVTESAARLTRSLLGFARQGKNLSQRVCVNEITGRVAELARRTVGRQILVKSALCEGRLEVEGDGTQLEQLLMNLVVNGRDAIEGTGSLTIRSLQREVSETEIAEVPAGRYAVLEVEDTGTGIAPAVRDRVFEPYFTTKTAGAVKGTGLGLATVFGIVESHRGRVSIARTGPTGTVMRVLLPLAADRERQASPERIKVAREPGRGTILVVDDEALVLRVTTHALEALGYRVLAAVDGAGAIEAFRSARGEVDAVVLDLVMPVMSGREAFLALKALDPGVRVLLMTGYALNYEAQELLNLGVCGFVAKPFSIDELSSAIARLIRGTRASSAPKTE